MARKTSSTDGVALLKKRMDRHAITAFEIRAQLKAAGLLIHHAGDDDMGDQIACALTIVDKAEEELHQLAKDMQDLHDEAAEILDVKEVSHA